MDQQIRVLVVDDDEGHARAVAESLERVGYDCVVATSGSEGLRLIEEQVFDIVITDLIMEGVDGMEVLARAKRELPDAEVVILTGHSTIKGAVSAMQAGASNYLIKPLDINELRTVADKASQSQRLHRSNIELQKQLNEKFGFEGVIGNSPAMHGVVAKLRQIAPTSASVLITGESGTGKELVAKALHINSPRKNKPFVPLNCAAFARDIVENELFGHEKGAFTGANERKRGLFELADKGTIFLDEIGEMEPSTQAKLLRVLERNEFRRVGGAGKIKIDVSVVAASNRDLDAAIAEGRFRNDLYYRLKVVTLAVPPLRDRKEDIPLLVDHFVEDFNRRHGPMIQGVAPRALARLVEHDWPGNVRELRNVVESAAIFAAKDTIQVREVLEALEKATPPGATSALPVNLTLAEAERRLILDAVRRSPTKVEAARSLGIGLRTLYTKLEEYRAVPNQRSPRRDGAPSVSIPRSD